jgi:hypothetical protein
MPSLCRGRDYTEGGENVEFEDFDELARGLAQNEISRRQALRWAGMGALATALSTVGFSGTAEALTRRQRRRCVERGGIVCGETRREEYCCRSGTTCAGGGTCGEGCRRPGSCATGEFPDCQRNPDCFCTETEEGGSFCAQSSIPCALATSCTTSQDCPTGWVCARTCCGEEFGPLCNPPCGTGTAAAGASSAHNGRMNGR